MAMNVCAMQDGQELTATSTLMNVSQTHARTAPYVRTSSTATCVSVLSAGQEHTVTAWSTTVNNFHARMASVKT